ARQPIGGPGGLLPSERGEARVDLGLQGEAPRRLGVTQEDQLHAAGRSWRAGRAPVAAATTGRSCCPGVKQQSAGQASWLGPRVPDARAAAPSVRSSTSSRIIATNRGSVPTVPARTNGRPIRA